MCDNHLSISIKWFPWNFLHATLMMDQQWLLMILMMMELQNYLVVYLLMKKPKMIGESTTSVLEREYWISDCILFVPLALVNSTGFSTYHYPTQLKTLTTNTKGLLSLKLVTKSPFVAMGPTHHTPPTPLL